MGTTPTPNSRVELTEYFGGSSNHALDEQLNPADVSE